MTAWTGISTATPLPWFENTPLVIDVELASVGVIEPLVLKIEAFNNIQHPMLKREVCGGDASAEFKRTDFGLSYGTPRFAPEVKLQIQVEAIKN